MLLNIVIWILDKLVEVYRYANICDDPKNAEEQVDRQEGIEQNRNA